MADLICIGTSEDGTCRADCEQSFSHKPAQTWCMATAIARNDGDLGRIVSTFVEESLGGIISNRGVGDCI